MATSTPATGGSTQQRAAVAEGSLLTGLSDTEELMPALPSSVLQNIFLQLSVNDRAKTSIACRDWRQAMLDLYSRTEAWDKELREITATCWDPDWLIRETRKLNLLLKYAPEDVELDVLFDALLNFKESDKPLAQAFLRAAGPRLTSLNFCSQRTQRDWLTVAPVTGDLTRLTRLCLEADHSDDQIMHLAELHVISQLTKLHALELRLSCTGPGLQDMPFVPTFVSNLRDLQELVVENILLADPEGDPLDPELPGWFAQQLTNLRTLACRNALTPSSSLISLTALQHLTYLEVNPVHEEWLLFDRIPKQLVEKPGLQIEEEPFELDYDDEEDEDFSAGYSGEYTDPENDFEDDGEESYDEESDDY